MNRKKRQCVTGYNRNRTYERKRNYKNQTNMSSKIYSITLKSHLNHSEKRVCVSKYSFSSLSISATWELLGFICKTL